VPLIGRVGATSPTPWLPETAELPPFENVKLTPEVPAVLFRLVLTVAFALPGEAVALFLRPERVRALGLADAFVFADARTFFDGFTLMVRPDRGAEPFALFFVADR